VRNGRRGVGARANAMDRGSRLTKEKYGGKKKKVGERDRKVPVSSKGKKLTDMKKALLSQQGTCEKKVLKGSDSERLRRKADRESTAK